MSLPKLEDSLPRGYWHHSSGGEHAYKHLGDVEDIRAIRRSYQDIEENDTHWLRERLLGNGIVTVRHLQPNGGAGDIAGYVVADRTSRRGVVEVEDIQIDEKRVSAQDTQHIAGYLIGKLITSVPMQFNGLVSMANYGTALELNGENYRLPGAHLTANELSLGDDLDRFKESLPRQWSGIRSIDYKSGDSIHEVFQDGRAISEIEALDGPTEAYRIPNRTQLYPHIAFAAIDILNI